MNYYHESVQFYSRHYAHKFNTENERLMQCVISLHIFRMTLFGSAFSLVILIYHKTARLFSSFLILFFYTLFMRTRIN